MSKNVLSFKGIVGNEDTISCLEKFLDALKQGQVCLQSGEQEVFLTPSGNVKMEVKAESKPPKQKLEIELSWREDEQAEAEPCSLSISSRKPATQEDSEQADQEAKASSSPASSGPTIAAGQGPDTEEPRS